MTRGGIILRLIDIVLILLFGFISISEISRKSPIKLPKSSETPISEPDREEILVIGITQDGKFLVENETKIIEQFEHLKAYITLKNEEYKKHDCRMRVRIRSNYNAPIKYTMAIANFCDKWHIPKGVDVMRPTQ